MAKLMDILEHFPFDPDKKVPMLIRKQDYSTALYPPNDASTSDNTFTIIATDTFMLGIYELAPGSCFMPLDIHPGDESYYKDLSGSKDFAFKVITDLVGGENKGSPTSFTWGTLASLGTATLALHKDLISESEFKTVEQSFQEAGDFYLKQEAKSAYSTPYPGHTYDTTVTDIVGDESSERSITLTGGYEWGSNSMVINNAMILGMAYDLTGDLKYLSGVTSAMDYILGKNVIENSYVTGYGTSTTEHPHHRYWCKQMKPDWPSAPDGCLSGGPNSDMNDPMIQGAGYKIGELAPMKCYYDQVDAWSVNEITINWNSPVVWISSFMDDYKDASAAFIIQIVYSDDSKSQNYKIDTNKNSITIPLDKNKKLKQVFFMSDKSAVKVTLENLSFSN